MIDFNYLPQSAVLPFDCHIGATDAPHTASPITNVTDNLPTLPTKVNVIDNWPPPKSDLHDNWPPPPKK